MLEARHAAQRARLRRRLGWVALAVVVLLPLATFALPSRNVFNSGEVISAGDVNTNFENLWNQVEANASAVEELESGHEVVFSDSIARGFVVDTESEDYVAVIGDDGQLSVELTTNGRPVFVGLIGEGTNSEGDDVVSSIRVYEHPGYAGLGYVRITRTPDGGSETNVVTHTLNNQAGVGGSDGTVDSQNLRIPASSVSHIEPLEAGTYTYKLEARLANGSGLQLQNLRLVAYEL